MDGRLGGLLRRQTQRADEAAKRVISDGAKSLRPGSLLNRARRRTGAAVAKAFREEADASYAEVKRELDRIADAAADETARKIEALTGRPAKAARGAVDGRQLREDLRRSNARRAKNADRALGQAVRGTPPGKRDAAASEAAKSAWRDVAKSRQRKRFVDSRGRAWKDSVYNEMRARTMEANAKRAAQIATLRANGFKLARISDGVQETTCEDCHQWRGAIVSLTGRAYRGYPALEKVVATTKLFHPNCIHYVEPHEGDESYGRTPIQFSHGLFNIGISSGAKKDESAVSSGVPDVDAEIAAMSKIGEADGIEAVLKAAGGGKRLLEKVGYESRFAPEIKSQVVRLASIAEKIANDEMEKHVSDAMRASEALCAGNAERSALVSSMQRMLPRNFQDQGFAFHLLPTDILKVMEERTISIREEHRAQSVSELGHVILKHVTSSRNVNDYRIANLSSEILHECGHCAIDLSNIPTLTYEDGEFKASVSDDGKKLLEVLEEEAKLAMSDMFGDGWRNDEELKSNDSDSFLDRVAEREFGCDCSVLPPTYQCQVLMFSDLVQNATRGEYGAGHTYIDGYFGKGKDHFRASEICAEAISCFAFPKESSGNVAKKYFGRTIESALRLVESSQAAGK